MNAFLALFLALFLYLGHGGAPPYSPYFSPSDVYRQQSGDILLTFDDGPSPYTGRILDTLKANHVKAAFFLVGQNVRKYPELVARIAADGHYIGNHTEDHIKLTTLSLAQEKREILEAQASLGPYGAAKWVRPPFGELPYDLASWLKSQGYKVIRWSALADGTDFRPGDIVLLHETAHDVDELPGLIAKLRKTAHLEE